MTDDFLPPPGLGAGLGDALPLPDWLTDGGLPGLPDLPDPFADSAAAVAVAEPPPVVAPVTEVIPMPTVTPPPRKLPEPGNGPLIVPARVVVEEDGRTLCFCTAVTPPLGGWDDVRAVFRTPAGVKSAQVNRKPKITPGRVAWTLGTLTAGSSVPLIVRVPNGPHLAAAAADPPPFEITYTPRIAPDLEVSVGGPARLRPADEFLLKVTVDNLGLGAAEEVSVIVTRRDTPDEPISRLVGRVAPGEATEVVFRLPAPAAEGPCRWNIRVASADQYTTHLFDADVSAPLGIEATVPAAFDLDDVVPFRATVTNPSERACRNVVVGMTVPAELKYDSSDGEYRWEAGRVEWRVAELEPGETRTVTAWLKGHLPGPVALTADVTTADGTSTATARSVCNIGRTTKPSSVLDLLRDLDPGAATDLGTDRAAPVTGERHVLFRMGDAAYAAPIAQLREVIRPPAVTPVPGAPDWLLGLANVRGDALSIIDFPTALGLEAGGGEGKKSVLVAQTADGETAVGLAVDEVIGIRRLTPNPWSADDALDAGRVGEFVTGLCEHQDRLTPVFDLDRALRSDALAAFAGA